jgi:DNA-binding IclR family transcriptional regulator
VDGRPPGPHPLTLADWPFGSAARRGLLETVLLGPTPAAGWTTRELERQAGVARGGLRHALDGAQAWGLLHRDPTGRWRPPDAESALAPPLRALLQAIGSSHSEIVNETKRSRRRQAILTRLASGPAHVTELSTLTAASRATTYRELRALRDARAITVERGVARRA